MALIRALTVFISAGYGESTVEHIVGRVINIADRVAECVRQHGINPWTLRIVIPPVAANWSVDRCRELTKQIHEISSDWLVHSLGLEIDSGCAAKVFDVLNEYKRAYASIRCDDDSCLIRASDIIKNSYKDYEPEVFTRFALTVGPWISTPYFPATTNNLNQIGFSVALRYVDLIKESVVLGRADGLFKFIGDTYEKLRSIASCANIPFLGFDLSISPWMEESVAEIVELLIENRIGYPGTVNAIVALNRMIRLIASKAAVPVIGFNEVMLPVAEDSLLNERVRTGVIRLRDLVNYSAFCVAGLDMVSIPIKMISLERLLMDMLTIYNTKFRTIGVRVVPIDAEPGSRVHLPRFGDTFVIQP